MKTCKREKYAVWARTFNMNIHIHMLSCSIHTHIQNSAAGLRKMIIHSTVSRLSIREASLHIMLSHFTSKQKRYVWFVYLFINHSFIFILLQVSAFFAANCLFVNYKCNQRTNMRNRVIRTFFSIWTLFFGRWIQIWC